MTAPARRQSLAIDPQARRAVFARARWLYLEWLDVEAPLILGIDHDRIAFNRLAKAARGLDLALRSFGAVPDRSLLNALLQRQLAHCETQHAIGRMMGDLEELLG